MRYVVLLVGFFCCFDLLAQPSTDQQLANLYYTNGEYEKAVMYYEKIIQRQSPKFEVLRYVECLEKTNQPKEAEKILKKQLAANQTDVEYKIILGDFYERNDRKDQAEKLFGELIKSVSGNGYEAVELYNNFVRRGKVEWGLKTLEAA
jgi:tetratricopeptide (TPR) repeat protein